MSKMAKPNKLQCLEFNIKIGVSIRSVLAEDKKNLMHVTNQRPDVFHKFW